MDKDLERRMRRSRLVQPSAELDRRMELLLETSPRRARTWGYAVLTTALCIVTVVLGFARHQQDTAVACLSPDAYIVVAPDQMPKAFWGSQSSKSQWDSWKVESFVEIEKEIEK